jgi:hypothetical protein
MPHVTPAQYAIRLFGGVRKTAKAIHRTPGAVSMWKRNGRVPVDCVAAIILVMRQRNQPCSAESLIFGTNDELPDCYCT